MELKNLSHDERIAIIALMKLFVQAHPQGSEEEAEDMALLVDVFGEKEYRKLLDEAETRFETEDDYKQFFMSITRQEARELIFETALECASEDGVEPQESDILEWLTDEWNIRVEFQERGYFEADESDAPAEDER